MASCTLLSSLMLRRIAVFLPVLLLLSACRNNSTPSPEAVIERSLQANQQLQNASFTIAARFSFHMPGMSRTAIGTVNIQGNLQNAGKQISSEFETRGVLSDPSGQGTWNGNGSFLIPDDGFAYANVRQFSFDPAGISAVFPNAAGMLGTWQRYPLSRTSSGTNTIAPDPSFLRLQSAVIKVTRDRGIEQWNGRSVYHYNVEIDREKIRSYLEYGMPRDRVNETKSLLNEIIQDMQSNGELWIDSETYLLRRASWSMAKSNAFDVQLEMTVQESATPMTIIAPSSSSSSPPSLLPSMPPQ